MREKLLLAVAVGLVGLMLFIAHRVTFLTDHVNQLLDMPMETTKTTRWICCEHGDQEEVKTTGPDADAVCTQHEATVLAEKKKHRPCPPEQKDK